MSSALAEIERALSGLPDGPDRRALEEVAQVWRSAGTSSAKHDATIAFAEIGATPAPSFAEWIWPLTADDLPAPGAAAFIGPHLDDAPVDAVVADDVILDGTGAQLRAKPVYDRFLASFADYAGRAVSFRRSALDRLGASVADPAFSPVALLAQLAPERIAHAPYPAILSRTAPKNSNTQPVATPAPPTSVIIPNRDSPELIARCLQGVYETTRAADLDVIIVDNGSENAETLAIYRRYEEDAGMRIIRDPAPFNFSAMVNAGAAAARFDHLLLLNNDVEMIADGWLAEMSGALVFENVGVVGAKLLFPDHTIQHAGVILGHGGVAGHDMKGAPEDAADPLGRMRFPHSRSAVTAAAMLTRKDVWSALGGFDERVFPVAFNDVDYCLRARERGFGVAMAPSAVLIHHEGQSRRRGVSLSRFIRHKRERAELRARHGTVGMTDPFENPWRDHDALIPEWRAPQGPFRLRY